MVQSRLLTSGLAPYGVRLHSVAPRSHWHVPYGSRKRGAGDMLYATRSLEHPGNRRASILKYSRPKRRKMFRAGPLPGRERRVSLGAVLAAERVRAQLSAQRGGADIVFDDKGLRAGGARLLAVVTLRSGEIGRSYRVAE